MISVRCRSCGGQYDYSKDGCCPRCGAYNRPPRQELVDADGTVRHVTDEAFARRDRAELGKICFEEKEHRGEKASYEHEAPPASRKRKQARLSVLAVMIAAVLIPGILMVMKDDETARKPALQIEKSADGESFGEPIVGYHETPRFFEAEDGSVFSLIGWWQEDDAISVEIIADFADSDHEFCASLVCIGENGYALTLTEFETGGDETDVLRFFTEGEALKPQTFVLEEWDHASEDAPVAVWEARLDE